MSHAEYAYITLPEEFGAAIRQARIRQGMSQVQLAEASGVSQRFVSQLERGKQTAELGKALQVACVAGLRLRLDAGRTPEESRELVMRGIARIADSLERRPPDHPKLADILAAEGSDG